MDWTFWVGLGVFVVTVAGLLVLRRGTGDRSTRPSRRERLIMTTLLKDDNAPVSAAVVRRRVGGSRKNVAELLERLERRVLVTSARLTVDGVGTQRRYWLTDRGVVEVRYPARTQRGRHRL